MRSVNRSAGLASLARAGGMLGVAAAAVLLLAAPAAATEQGTRWMPWLGCWEPVMEGAPDGQATLLCFEATPDPDVVVLVKYAGAETVSREEIAVRGERRAVDEGGCAGWESSSWSADGRRVHLSGALTCQGGIQRSLSGVLSMAGLGEWVSVQSVHAAGEDGVRVLRYRVASPQRAALAGQSVVPEQLALAVQTSRSATAAPLRVEAVLDASLNLRQEVVEALLIERGDGFTLNARALLALRDEGVPGPVLDLMIALSHPERFAINRSLRAGEPLPAGHGGTAAAFEPVRRYPGGVYDAWGRPLSGYGVYGVSRYGYYDYGLGPRGYGSWYGAQPVVIVIRDGEGGSAGRPKPRADAQRGYTQQPRTSTPSTTSTAPATSGASSGSGSSTSSGAATTSGSTGSGTSTGRTAIPRTGGGGGGSQ
jgi:hypothetical protein